MLSRDFEEMDDEVEVNKWMEVDPDLKASQSVGPNIKVWLASSLGSEWTIIGVEKGGDH